MTLSFRDSRYRTLLRDIVLSVPVFGAVLLALAVVMSILNHNAPNSFFLPIQQYVAIFSTIWHDNPWGALQLIANKTLFAFGYFDARSELYLWTLEFDTLTTFVYWLVAYWSLAIWRTWRHTAPQARAWALLGLALLLFARTYGQVLAHCAGPNWVGFISLYALGMQTFPVNSSWQWMFAVSGVALLIYASRLRLNHLN